MIKINGSDEYLRIDTKRARAARQPNKANNESEVTKMFIKGAKARGFINQYERCHNPVTLWDCYSNPSIAKENAWDFCKRQCKKYNGARLTVLSYNRMKFTAAFEYPNPETGELMLHVETANYSYDMYM